MADNAPANKELTFFDKLQLSARIVSVNTEISVLTDQVEALKRRYGEQGFDLMADPEANAGALTALYAEIYALMKPKLEIIAAKEVRKRELQAAGGNPPDDGQAAAVAAAAAPPPAAGDAGDADAPKGWQWDAAGHKR